MVAFITGVHMTNDNLEYYQDAYEIGPEKTTSHYAATQHVDQGLCSRCSTRDIVTTRDVNVLHLRFWRKGIKTSRYHMRIRQQASKAPRRRAASLR